VARRGSLLRSENGQAAVELAFVLPLLIALLLAIVQFGIAFNNYITLTDATRAGARKAAVSRFAGDNGASAVAAVKAAASDLDQTKLSVTVTSTDWTTPGSDVSVSATYPFSVNILGWSVTSGTLTSTTEERLE
jgi:Flp pilus assembly protein TadG